VGWGGGWGGCVGWGVWGGGGWGGGGGGGGERERGDRAFDGGGVTSYSSVEDEELLVLLINRHDAWRGHRILVC